MRSARRRWFLTLVLVVCLVVAAVVVWRARPHHVRVLVVGDSITTEYGPQVVHDFGQRGVSAHSDGYPGYGLLDQHLKGGTIQTRLSALVNRYRPQAVVVEFVGNYGFLSAVLPGAPPDSPDFFAQWARAAREATLRLHAHGAHVYWLSNLPMGSDPLRRRSAQIDAIYRALPADPGLAGAASYLDVKGPFGGDGYQPALRQQDGVHLNPAGVGVFARTVADGVLFAEAARPGPRKF